jgi:uncharacterized peroxidase-related enzyme
MLFNSLTPSSGVREALLINGEAGNLLRSYHECILRGASPLTISERELIATYVSGLNSCKFCHETHLEAAFHFGIDRELVVSLVADPDVSDAPERLRPLLRYARILTLNQTSIQQQDADAVRDAGWDERALHDLILIAAMFNFMNRFVHGHGIHGDASQWKVSGRYLFEHGYKGVAPYTAAALPAE